MRAPKLQARLQTLLLSVLLGLASDAQPTVRCAALRALGNVVSFPSNAKVCVRTQ